MNKTSKEKNHVSERNGLAAKPIIFWVMCIICGIIAVAAIYANYFSIKMGKIQEACLSDGLAIIGLAIAVWAGLNIANAVERKELEALSEKSKALTDKTEVLGRQIEPLAKNAESIDKTLNGLFLERLLKTAQDEASQWFLGKFAEIINDDTRAEMLKENISRLINIENKFSLVYGLHTSKQHNDRLLFNEADEAINEINKIIGEKNETESHAGLNLVNIYLKFRRAEFEFYKGYATKNAQEVYDRFRNAAKAYIDIHEEFGVFLPAYMKEMDLKDIPEYISDEEVRKLSVYFANSIGEAYSRIMLLEDGLKNNYTLSGKKISVKELKEIGRMSIFYCACAAKWAEKGGIGKEVYFRNLGCAYERLERLNKKTGEYAEEIFENYKKAFACIVDQDEMSYRIQSVYYTFMQYSKKFLEMKLHISDVYKNMASFQEAVQNKAVVKKLEEKEELWEILKDYYKIIVFAKRDKCRHHLQYEMEGFAMSILIILKLAKYKKVHEICELDVEECKKVIKENVAMLKFMNIEDGYYKELVKRKKIIFGENEEEGKE